MKNLMLFLFVSILAISCQTGDSKSTDTTQPEGVAEYVLYEVAIEGMTCTGCEQTVESGVAKVEGVSTIEANHIDANAQIKFIKGKTDTVAIKKSIEASGYKVLGFKEITGDKPGE